MMIVRRCSTGTARSTIPGVDEVRNDFASRSWTPSRWPWRRRRRSPTRSRRCSPPPGTRATARRAVHALVPQGAGRGGRGDDHPANVAERAGNDWFHIEDHLAREAVGSGGADSRRPRRPAAPSSPSRPLTAARVVRPRGRISSRSAGRTGSPVRRRRRLPRCPLRPVISGRPRAAPPPRAAAARAAAARARRPSPRRVSRTGRAPLHDEHRDAGGQRGGQLAAPGCARAGRAGAAGRPARARASAPGAGRAAGHPGAGAAATEHERPGEPPRPESRPATTGGPADVQASAAGSRPSCPPPATAARPARRPSRRRRRAWPRPAGRRP